MKHPCRCCSAGHSDAPHSHTESDPPVLVSMAALTYCLPMQAAALQRQPTAAAAGKFKVAVLGECIFARCDGDLPRQRGRMCPALLV